MMLRALLADMSLVSFDGSVASLRCAPGVRSIAEKKLDDLGRLMSNLCGSTVRVELITADAASEDASQAQSAVTAPSRAGEDHTSESADPPTAFEPDTDHPIVIKTLEMFNGRIVEVKPVRKKPLDE